MSPRATTATAPEALDAVFFALADGTRRQLLARLRGERQTAGALAEGFALSRPAVSRHLAVLRAAALVREEKRGRERVYSLAPGRLAEAAAWLEDYRLFWTARLHDLKTLVESLPDEPPHPEKKR
jgi:DNA-binding transcriptional ArsR family regulator